MAGFFFDDVSKDQMLPVMDTGRLTIAHLVRWCGASENWHRIHYDEKFATEHDRLPGPLINGSLKQQFLVRYLKNWAHPHGWLWKLDFRFRAMNVVGEALQVWGRVVDRQVLDRYGLAMVELGIKDEAGRESTPARATVALPFRDGPPLSYPFVAPDFTEKAREA